MQEKVKIRAMSIDDLDRVDEIGKAVYGPHHWPKDSFISEIKSELSRYYVLINNENIICGYAGCWHILEEAHLTNIAVANEFKKRNYGATLLKRIIDGCYKEKIKYITLEVRKSNIPAINLYSKFGFISFGERKKYYQDNNEDAVIMWTKNIFFDEYKSIFEKVTNELAERILVEYEQQ